MILDDYSHHLGEWGRYVYPTQKLSGRRIKFPTTVDSGDGFHLMMCAKTVSDKSGTLLSLSKFRKMVRTTSNTLKPTKRKDGPPRNWMSKGSHTKPKELENYSKEEK